MTFKQQRHIRPYAGWNLFSMTCYFCCFALSMLFDSNLNLQRHCSPCGLKSCVLCAGKCRAKGAAFGHRGWFWSPVDPSLDSFLHVSTVRRWSSQVYWMGIGSGGDSTPFGSCWMHLEEKQNVWLASHRFCFSEVGIGCNWMLHHTNLFPVTQKYAPRQPLKWTDPIQQWSLGLLCQDASNRQWRRLAPPWRLCARAPTRRKTKRLQETLKLVRLEGAVSLYWDRHTDTQTHRHTDIIYIYIFVLYVFDCICIHMHPLAG